MWCCCSGQEMSCELGKCVFQLRLCHHSSGILLSSILSFAISLWSAVVSRIYMWLSASFHVTTVSAVQDTVKHLVVGLFFSLSHLVDWGKRQQQAVIFQYLLHWADGVLEEVISRNQAGQHYHLVAGNILISSCCTWNTLFNLTVLSTFSETWIWFSKLSPAQHMCPAKGSHLLIHTYTY